MDQRTDTEHRLDAAPGHDINPAIGEARKTQPWLDRMRRRRRQVLVITALIIGHRRNGSLLAQCQRL